MIRLIIIYLFLLSPALALCQTDSCWTVMLVQKGHKVKVKPVMNVPSKTGFYLYRNCCYNITLKNGARINGRLINIKPDTLYFSNFLDQKIAEASNKKLDTVAVYYRQLDEFAFMGSDPLKFAPSNKIDNYNFVFKKDISNCLIQSKWQKISPNDSTLYELVPNCNIHGMDYLYDYHGMAISFWGNETIKYNDEEIDTTYHKRNVIWFTPNEVEQINGLAVGLLARNVKTTTNNQRDSLKIQGVNVELSLVGFMALPFFKSFSGPHADSIEVYNKEIKNNCETKINGVNVALVSIYGIRVTGINANFLVSAIDEIHGVSITGLHNFSYIMNGVSIAGIDNWATSARGLQIGLFNKAIDMRGIQIGLWNVNGKRSLPFINWQFKPSETKNIN